MQTIDINTNQNVQIQYDLAPWFERMFAFFIDLIIIAISFLLVSMVVGLLFSPEDQDTVFIISGLPIVFFYSLVSELVMDGQSFGKKALKIKVMKIDGKKPGIYEYLLRWAFRPVDIYYSFGALACILIIASDDGQRIGDILAHTTVVKTSPKRYVNLGDILKIKSLATYTPQYTEIRKVSEEDMLIVMDMIKSYEKFPNKAHAEALVTLATKISERLNLPEVPTNKKDFLSTVLKDYIVLTR